MRLHVAISVIVNVVVAVAGIKNNVLGQKASVNAGHVDIDNKNIPGIFGWYGWCEHDLYGIIFENKSGFGRTFVDDVTVYVDWGNDHIPALEGVNKCDDLVALPVEGNCKKPNEK